MHLGIENNTGLVYEGLGSPSHPVIPTPNITRATLIETDADWGKLSAPNPSFQWSWIFREDSFDAVTRTRRGRLYIPVQGSQPNRQYVALHPYDIPAHRQSTPAGDPVKDLLTYQACTALLSHPHQGQGMTLALGAAGAISAWRIVQSELLASHNVLVTLKALSAYGILPELDASRIHPEHRAAVQQAIDRALDAAFRETPISVIDHCRNALAVILARWMAQQGHDEIILTKDLGAVAEAIAGKPHELTATAHLARTVARLHARGKGNEQHARGSRTPVEEDAQLALEALGFALRDMGWAKT